MNGFIIVILLAAVVALVAGVWIGFMLGLRTALKSIRQPPTPLPSILCSIGAAVMLMASVGTAIYSTYFLASSQSAPATVIEIRERKDSEGNISRHPVYQYADASGAEHRDTTSLSGGREFAVGDVIPIRYLRNSPAESRIDYFDYHWFLPIFLAVGSVAIGTVGATLYWNYRRQLKSAPAEPANMNRGNSNKE